MKTRAHIALAAATTLFIGMPAFAGDEKSHSDRDQKASQSDRASGDRSGVRQISNESYYSECASNVLYQKELDKLAAEKANDPQIRQFAQQNLQRSQQQMQRISEDAKKASVNIDKSKKKLTESQQARLDELRQMEGSEFDRNYAFETSTNRYREALAQAWASRHGDQNVQQTAQWSQQTARQSQQDADAMLVVFVPVEDQNRARTAGGQMGGTSDMNRTGQGRTGDVQDRNLNGRSSGSSDIQNRDQENSRRE